jgi:hypothetical protein
MDQHVDEIISPAKPLCASPTSPGCRRPARAWRDIGVTPTPLCGEHDQEEQARQEAARYDAYADRVRAVTGALGIVGRAASTTVPDLPGAAEVLVSLDDLERLADRVGRG